MEPSHWARDKRAHFTAVREWSFLYDTLVQLGARVELVAPATGLPDLVFTANAGVVLDRPALLARFRITLLGCGRRRRSTSACLHDRRNSADGQRVITVFQDESVLSWGCYNGQDVSRVESKQLLLVERVLSYGLLRQPI